MGDLKTWLLARGYKENEVDSQVARVRLKNRVALLDTNPQAKDDMRIPLVLTYHPVLHKVYEIIRGNENVLLVDNEHKNVFKDKIFVSFRRAKNLKVDEESLMKS